MAQLPASVKVKAVVTNVNDEKKALVKRKASPEWLKKLYDPILLSNDEVLEIYDLIRYKGFDRDVMLARLEDLIGDPKLVAEIVITCAVRGPRQASLMKLRNGRTIAQMGVPASDQKGTENLSCARVAAATADLAAFYMKRLDVPKRLPTSNLPGWLQFPTAGSIKLPADLRDQHIAFSKVFSTQIGGLFNEQIYGTMMANAYLDPNLHLFD